MESLLCSVCGKCSGIIQVSQRGLQTFVCDQCSSDQAQANRIPGIKAVETMKSEYYNQAIISLKHHESILISFKSQMMQFRSELENILHLTFDKSIRDLDELSLEIQKKCKIVETIQDTEKEQQIYTTQTAQGGLQITESHSKKAFLDELHTTSHSKDDKSYKCLTESQICKEVQTSKVDDDTLHQYEQKIRDLEQKLEQLNVILDQKERETLELNTQVETIKRESATKDVKLLGFKNLNEAMIKKLHLRDAEILQLKSQNSTDSHINTGEGLVIARLRSQVEVLAQQISAKQATVIQLEARSKDLEIKLSGKDDIISQLKSQCNDLKYSLSAKDSEVSQYISELQVAARKLADRELEISKLSSEYEVISKELLAKDSEISHLKAQYNSKLDHESQLLNRFKSIQSILISLLTECRNLKHDNLNLSQELIRYKQEAATLYQQVSPCLQQFKDLQLKTSMIPQLESTIQKLTDHNQILEQELRDLDKNPRLDHEIEALNVCYEKQTQTRDDLAVEEEDNLKKIYLEQVKQYEEKLEKQEKILIEKVKQYENQLAEIEKIHSEQLKQYEEKIHLDYSAQIKSKINQYEEKISSLKQDIQESNTEISRLRSLLDSQKSSYDKLKSLYNHSLQEFEQKLKGKEDEILNLSDEIKQTTSENLANIEAISILTSEKKLLSDNLESTQSSFKSLKTEWQIQAKNQTNLKKLNLSQALKVERLNMRYEDLYSHFLRSYDDYKNLDSDLKTVNLSSTSTDTESISWCLENILEELRNPSVVNSIHIAKRGTRSLVSYDISTQESTTYLLSNITHNFKYTSTCALSNGDVMIAGGCHPATGDAYLFRTQNKQCYKLASLNHPRGFISLFYHDKKVFAFGGSNVATSKKAEEYDIATNEWRELPDMLQAREGASCVSLRDNIYIIGGGTTSIEEYSIERRVYRMIGLSVSHYGNVGAVANDKVYIIGHSDLIITNSSLALLNTVEKRWDKLVILLSNVVIEDGSIWYFNHWTSRIERLSLITHERKDLVSL